MPKKSGTTLTRGAAKPASSTAGKKPAAAAKKPAATKSKAAPKAKAAEAEKPFSFITVRAGRLPGRIETIALNGGRTAGDALEGAGLRADGYEIRVNGALGDTSTNLTEGDTVLLVKKLKGN